MERNLFRRVEIAFPLLEKKLRQQVRGQLMSYVADTAQSWLLQPDGSYLAPTGHGKPVQQALLEEITGLDASEISLPKVKPGKAKSAGHKHK